MSTITVRKVPPKRLPPGTTLELRIGGRTVVATVIEDRGPLLEDGRHLIRLRGPLGGEELSDFDLSVDVAGLPEAAIRPPEAQSSGR